MSRQLANPPRITTRRTGRFVEKRPPFSTQSNTYSSAGLELLRSGRPLFLVDRLETSRLVLRKPSLCDAELIFARYASDPEVTRLVSWPTHTSVAATREFLESSEAEWSRWPAGPYLIESRDDKTLLGSTGLHFETRDRAMTGYVLARKVWGKGYATEALHAMIHVARCLDVAHLYALCHMENAPSIRVLEKCGFACDGVLRRHSTFPNLHKDDLFDVFSYSLRLGETGSCASYVSDKPDNMSDK